MFMSNEVINHTYFANVKLQLQTPKRGSLSSNNLEIINGMAQSFIVRPEDHIVWFVKSCNDSELSKTLFFFVLLQALLIKPIGLFSLSPFGSHFSEIYITLNAHTHTHIHPPGERDILFCFNDKKITI